MGVNLARVLFLYCDAHMVFCYCYCYSCKLSARLRILPRPHEMLRKPRLALTLRLLLRPPPLRLLQLPQLLQHQLPHRHHLHLRYACTHGCVCQGAGAHSHCGVVAR